MIIRRYLLLSWVAFVFGMTSAGLSCSATDNVALAQVVGAEKTPITLHPALALLIAILSIVMFVITRKTDKIFFRWAYRVFPPVVFKILFILIALFVVASVALVATIIATKN
jgi:hypothetical protein